jgi:hypothetical protein
VAGGHGRRSQAATTAGAVAPASRRLGRGNKRREKLRGVLGEVGATRDGGASGGVWRRQRGSRGTDEPGGFYRQLKVAKAVHKPVFSMARGTATPGVAGQPGTARLANGERRPARGSST